MPLDIQRATRSSGFNVVLFFSGQQHHRSSNAACQQHHRSRLQCAFGRCRAPRRRGTLALDHHVGAVSPLLHQVRFYFPFPKHRHWDGPRRTQRRRFRLLPDSGWWSRSSSTAAVSFSCPCATLSGKRFSESSAPRSAAASARSLCCSTRPDTTSENNSAADRDETMPETGCWGPHRGHFSIQEHNSVVVVRHRWRRTLRIASVRHFDGCAQTAERGPHHVVRSVPHGLFVLRRSRTQERTDVRWRPKVHSSSCTHRSLWSVLNKCLASLAIQWRWDTGRTTRHPRKTQRAASSVRLHASAGADVLFPILPQSGSGKECLIVGGDGRKAHRFLRRFSPSWSSSTTSGSTPPASTDGFRSLTNWACSCLVRRPISSESTTFGYWHSFRFAVLSSGCFSFLDFVRVLLEQCTPR